jgi:hypothetical protein
VLRDAGPDNPRLAPFADQPVHLVVRGDDFLIEPTTDAIIAQRLAERMDRPLIKLRWRREDKLRSYDELAAGSPSRTLSYASRYGSKASNLGFLADAQVLGRASDPGSPSAEAGYELVVTSRRANSAAGRRLARLPRFPSRAGKPRPGTPIPPTFART